MTTGVRGVLRKGKAAKAEDLVYDLVDAVIAREHAPMHGQKRANEELTRAREAVVAAIIKARP